MSLTENQINYLLRQVEVKKKKHSDEIKKKSGIIAEIINKNTTQGYSTNNKSILIEQLRMHKNTLCQLNELYDKIGSRVQ